MAKEGGIGGVVGSLMSLVKGVGVTGRTLFEPKVTEMYPHTKPQLSPVFASCIEFVRFDELEQSHDCIACDKCAKVCPSYCIELSSKKLPNMKKQRAAEFHVDYSLCSLCGLCIDVCPTETLKWSTEFDEAHYSRDEWVHNLLVPFDGQHSDERMAEILIARDERVKQEKRLAREAAKAAKAEALAKAADNSQGPADS